MVVILLLSPSGSSHTPPSPPQQFFLEKPEDTQVVELTKEVTLTCRIANLSGQVQWSKDGFLLGKSARERARATPSLPPPSSSFLWIRRCGCWRRLHTRRDGDLHFSS